MKKPEEIKKGLECCITGPCPRKECPYYGLVPSCAYQRTRDALAYIKQLERERDRAVADLHALALKKGSCYACIHRPQEGKCEYTGRCTAVISDSDFWEWRGVKEDAHD